MVDLNEFVGDTPLRASLVKKQEKLKTRIDKAQAKITPLQQEFLMYGEMIAAVDKRLSGTQPEIAETSDAAEDSENTENMVNPYKKQNFADNPPLRQTDIEEFTGDAIKK